MRLIDADALYEEARYLEAQAIDYTVKISNDEEKREEWLRWSAILAERTAFKHDVYDAPTIEPEPRWIPCSERLPKEKQDVLLLMPQNMVVGFWEDVLSDGGRTWYANSGNGYFTDMDVLYGYDDPIAWMPLPKPYGGDEE